MPRLRAVAPASQPWLLLPMCKRHRPAEPSGRRSARACPPARGMRRAVPRRCAAASSAAVSACEPWLATTTYARRRGSSPATVRPPSSQHTARHSAQRARLAHAPARDGRRRAPATPKADTLPPPREETRRRVTTAPPRAAGSAAAIRALEEAAEAGQPRARVLHHLACVSRWTPAGRRARRRGPPRRPDPA